MFYHRTEYEARLRLNRTFFVIWPVLASAIGCKSWADDQTIHRKSDAKLTHKSITTPDGWDPVDWRLQDNIIVYSQRSNSKTNIRVLDIVGSAARDRPGMVVEDADFPLFVGRESIAYVQSGRLRVMSLAQGTVTDIVDLSGRGFPGELWLHDDRILLYTIKEHSDRPEPRMFSVSLSDRTLTSLGPGYYPRMFDSSELYFVDMERDYKLCAMTLTDGEPKSDQVRVLSSDSMYTPQVVHETSLLVCQQGFERPRIVLLTPEGRILKCLSDEGQSAWFPLVAPSGKYLAYAQGGGGESTAAVICDLEGRVMHKTPFGDTPISSAYRWSRTDNSIGVLVPKNKDSKKSYDIELTTIRD